ncbi:UbiA family prenyltransferase [Methanonatronarchaeum sp. AMET-Sl]|uniref:UbiA family prenyltransferase n=1 Tax=Methanonatronarchaeum sp. AMET-Sl TaxID=3037654 RepID=UPI00244E1A5E|nr:UbiA family prenyltransferase [Methanonatronarchaeum sp. AMET-Sl]WGI17744.1 UbiA family prenyltransferase [Methanonatronarchaeum sp. AMET-Sl]
MSVDEEYSIVDIGFGVAGPSGEGYKAKLLALLCVHRVLWLPWGVLGISAGLFLFMALTGEVLPLWKIVLGLLAAGLFTRVVSMADMVYDWWIGEDEALGPPNSSLPLVTGLLSPWTVLSLIILESVLCLAIAYLVFNLETFIVALVMLVWGITYSASPPIKNLTEFQRRNYRSLSGFMAVGGVAMVAPDLVLSWQSFLVASLVVVGCLAYHDKDSLRFRPLTPRETIIYTGVMSVLEIGLLFVVWIAFNLPWPFLALYLVLNIPKAREIIKALKKPLSHRTHIQLTHTGVLTYTVMLLLVNAAAIYIVL